MKKIKQITPCLAILILFGSFCPISTPKEKIAELARERLYPQALLTEKVDRDSWIQKDSLQNKALWLLEVQYPFQTSYTPFWDSYHPNQYHAKASDFEKQFSGKDSVLLAIQIGPDYWDLWAYRNLIFIKLNGYVVVAESYFRHNRFTHKAISILNRDEFNEFYSSISDLKNSTSLLIERVRVPYAGGYEDVEVILDDTILERKVFVSCEKESFYSGMLVDNLENESMRLYGLNRSTCSRKDRLMQKFSKYQFQTWIKDFNEFEWKLTYPPTD
ncbi:MAG: hypothetical protein AAGI38_24845 [Bacteroidota bacterium]